MKKPDRSSAMRRKRNTSPPDRIACTRGHQNCRVIQIPLIRKAATQAGLPEEPEFRPRLSPEAYEILMEFLVEETSAIIRAQQAAARAGASARVIKVNRPKINKKRAREEPY
jgi:hypothetical protein